LEFDDEVEEKVVKVEEDKKEDVQK